VFRFFPPCHIIWIATIHSLYLSTARQNEGAPVRRSAVSPSRDFSSTQARLTLPCDLRTDFFLHATSYLSQVYSRIRRDELHDQVCRRRDRAGSHALPARFARIHAGVCCVAAAARLQATCPACIAACPTRALALTLVVARSPTAATPQVSRGSSSDRIKFIWSPSAGEETERALHGTMTEPTKSRARLPPSALPSRATPSCATPSRATSSQACSRARAAERAQPSAHSRSRSSCSRSSCSSRRRAAAAAADDGESRILYQNCVK
jgi:hypothetical protein